MFSSLSISFCLICLFLQKWHILLHSVKAMVMGVRFFQSHITLNKSPTMGKSGLLII